MKFILPLLLISLLFFSACRSLDNIAQTIDELSLAQIEEIEIGLLKYQFEKNKADLSRAVAQLKKIEKKAANNRYFEAKVLALYARVNYLKNNQLEMRTYINEVEKRNNKEEYLFILKALIESDQNRKIRLLQRGLDQAHNTALISLFLADLRFIEGKFTRAITLYDEALLQLSEEYKTYYHKRRELAYQLNQQPPKNLETVQILLQDTLSIAQVLRVTRYESDYLSETIARRRLNDYQLLQQLIEENYFKENKLSLNDPINRAILAFYLLNLIAHREADQTLLNKYAVKFDYHNYQPESSSYSPIPDLRTMDYFYTAVLVLVEREIMELPDGEHFFPRRPVSGLDFYEILKKINRYY